MNRQSFKFRGLGAVIILAVIAVFSAVVMLLWNSLLPGIFALPVLNYWQALGILALSRILFGGIGGGFWDRTIVGAHGRGNHNSLREKWMNMSDEERKAFLEKEKGFRTMFHDRASQFREFYEEAKKKEGSARGDDVE
jgi:ABC-type multidrug transport system fused ATPase/permease subunit